MKEIKGDPFGVIEVENEEELEGLKANCGTATGLELLTFKRVVANTFKQLLPFMERENFINDEDFEYFADQIDIQNELARLRGVEEVLSDNLHRAWVVVSILEVVYHEEDLENINMTRFLEGLVLLIEHNIMTEYLEKFVVEYKEKYAEKLGFLNNYGYSVVENKKIETNLQTRIDKAAETIRLLIGEKYYTDEFGVETTCLLDDVHFYLKYGKVCSSLGSYWEDHGIK